MTEKTKKLQKGRVGVVFLVTGLLLGGLFLLRKPTSSARPGAVPPASQAAIWHEELKKEAEALPCPIQTGLTQRQRFVAQTRERLGFWRERELVDPAQGLRAWREIEQALRCAVPGQSENREALEQERERLAESLRGQLRAWHAAYLRAEKNGRNADALRAVRAMLVLVEAHTGEFRSLLERAERRLEKNDAS